MSAAGDAARGIADGISRDGAPGVAQAGGGRLRTDPLAGVVFACVVLATFAAFGVTQWLKHTPTPVQQLEISPAALRPGAAGEAGVEQIAFHLEHSDRVTVEVIDAQGDTVRTITRDLPLERYKRVELSWKGLAADHRPAPAGTYRLAFDLERQHERVLSPVTFEVLPPKGQP